MLHLVKTPAYPEQYDVYDRPGGQKIGRLRMRRGFFAAEYQGILVYHSCTAGSGMFTDDERVRELNRACAAIERMARGMRLDGTETPNYTVEDKVVGG